MAEARPNGREPDPQPARHTAARVSVGSHGGAGPVKPIAFVLSPVGRALVLLAFLLLVRAITFGTTVINADEEVFALAAREVLNGYLPYERLFDVKPVGSTLLLALAFKLLGLSIATVRLVGVACVWAAATTLAMLAARGGLGRLGAVFAGLIFIAYSTMMSGLATMTETLLIPFTILAVWLLHRALDPMPFRARLGLVAGAGVACGAAVLVKILPIVPGGLVAMLVCGLLVVRRQATVGQALALVASFGVLAVLPMAVAAGVHWQRGVLDQFLFANFGFARAYTAIHPALGVQAGRLATVVDAVWPLGVLAAVGAGAVLLSWRREKRVDDLGLMACAWLVGELASSSATLQFYPYYFLTTIPPLAVLSLVGIRALATWARADRQRVMALLATGVVLVGVEHGEVDFLRDRAARGDPSRRIAAVIRRDAGGRTPTLFVTSYELQSLYLLTGAPLPPTRFALPLHLMSLHGKVAGIDSLREINRVLASRPDYIVTDESEHHPQWAMAPLRPVLAHGYRPIWGEGTIRLYRAVARSAVPAAPVSG